MIVHYYQFDSDFLDSRPLMRYVMDVDALLMARAWDAAWDDMLHCWCGCPL